jgi:hypothetical protein
LDFFLCSCVKDHAHSQTMNMPDELKIQHIAVITDVAKDTLQRVWQEVDYMWELQMALGVKCLAPNDFSTCV